MKEESENVGLKLNIQKTKVMASSPISSVKFSHSAVFESLWPHESQHARLLCPPLSPRVCSNSYPLIQWCYLTIWYSATSSFCLQSFPASWSFPERGLFTSGGQNIAVSTSASVPPMNIQGWFLFGLTGLISLQPKGLSRVSPVPQLKALSH